MISIQMQQQINTLNNNQVVTVLINFYHPINDYTNGITGTVKKGITNCGKSYFYITPQGDNHPGASITKGDIKNILSFVS